MLRATVTHVYQEPATNKNICVSEVKQMGSGRQQYNLLLQHRKDLQRPPDMEWSQVEIPDLRMLHLQIGDGRPIKHLWKMKRNTWTEKACGRVFLWKRKPHGIWKKNIERKK